MWWYLLLIPRAILALLGLYLIVLRLASTDEEQAKAHGFLEKAWVRVGELREQALSRHVAFMKVIAGALDSGANRVFGQKILSIQSIVISIYLAFATLSLTQILVNRYSGKGWDIDSILSVFSDVLLATFLLFIKHIWDDPVKQEKIRIAWLSFLVAYLLMDLVKPMWASIQKAFLEGNYFVGQGLIALAVIVVTALAMYSFFVLLLRVSLRKISLSTSFYRIILITLLNLIPIIIVFGLFKLVGFRLEHTGWTTTGIDTSNLEQAKTLWANWQFKIDFFLIMLLVIVIFFDVLFLVTASISFILALLMIIHRFLWPLIHRFILGLHKNQIITTGKFLTVIGLLLIVIAFGKYSWIEKLWDKIF